MAPARQDAKQNRGREIFTKAAEEDRSREHTSSLRHLTMMGIQFKPSSASEPSLAASIWQAVESSDIKRAYKLVVTSDLDSNTTYDDLGVGDTYHSCDVEDRMNNGSTADG